MTSARSTISLAIILDGNLCISDHYYWVVDIMPPQFFLINLLCTVYTTTGGPPAPQAFSPHITQQIFVIMCIFELLDSFY